MNRTKYRNPHFNNHQTNGAGNNGQKKARIVKKLDPNLFINKPTPQNIETVNQFDQKAINFSGFEICDKLKRNIEDHGYTTPTPIQEKAIPEILAGRDLIGIANTGTGKTAAFLITLINKSYLDRNQRALIVVPTPELAIQIKEEFHFFAKGTNLEAVASVGGVNIKRQTYALAHRPHFVIGTPGRLKDLIGRGDLNLSLFQNIVLDEVDRMVDIGFIKDIKYLISLLPQKRQSLFFSATVDGKTEELLKAFVTNPVTVSVKRENTADGIEQDIVKVGAGRTKIDILHDLLILPGFDKVIIFGRTKWRMDSA